MAFNRTIRPPVTPTITAGAYAANDVVGGLIQLPVYTSGGVLRQLLIVDTGNVKAALDLWFFVQQPTVIADNLPFVPTADDLKKLAYGDPIQVVVNDYVTINSIAKAFKRDLDIDFVSPQQILFMYAVSPGTPTYLAANNLTFIPTLWGNEA